jgi:cation/acetate symporter
MDQTVWNFIFIGITFGVYIGIAIWSRAGSTKEYYTASGGVSPFANGMATAADWMSAATFISMAGGIAAAGYDGSRFLMGWTGGFVLLTTLMVPYLRKFGKATVPDFIGDRFYSNGARLVAVICAIFICMTYIMGQMRGVGVVFSQLFGISITSGVLIGGAIVFFYAGLGGMKGITYTQLAQYCVMVFAYTIPAIYISMILTGNAFPQFGLIGDLKATEEEQAVAFLQKLNEVNQNIGFAEYTSGKMSTMNLFFITAALMFGTAGLPHVIVRFFTVKNVKAVRISACWTLFFIAIVYLTAPTIGGFSRYNLIQKINGIEYQVAPKWFKQFEDTGQIVWVDKNNDGKIHYSGPLKDNDQKDKNNNVFLKAEGQFKAKPVFIEQKGPVGQRLISNDIDFTNPNELHYGNDIMVMANPYMAGEKGLPQPVIALLMAGCIAAALSTAAGLLLVLSTSVSHDLMKKILKPDISDKQEIRYARMASFVALALAAYFGINPPSSFVAKTVAFAFGLAASSFFPTLIMGIFSKKINKQGAIAGMISGIGFTLGYIIYFQFLTESKDYWFGISPEGIGFLGMFINFVVAFVVSSLTPPPPQDVQELVENIRVPQGAGKAIEH